MKFQKHQVSVPQSPVFQLSPPALLLSLSSCPWYKVEALPVPQHQQRVLQLQAVQTPLWCEVASPAIQRSVLILGGWGPLASRENISNYDLRDGKHSESFKDFEVTNQKL
jgi:hypothetical protein